MVSLQSFRENKIENITAIMDAVDSMYFKVTDERLRVALDSFTAWAFHYADYDFMEDQDGLVQAFYVLKETLKVSKDPAAADLLGVCVTVPVKQPEHILVGV